MSLRLKLEELSSIDKHRPFFFDTNVLIYIFWPTADPSSKWVAAYSGFLSQCIKSKRTICVDAWVLSEFINRACRLQYQQNVGRYSGFKDYRSSDDGKEVMKLIESVIHERILSMFDVVGKAFTKAEIASVPLINCDFNDQLILKTCDKHGCVLATHDADFASASVDVISANTRMVG